MSQLKVVSSDQMGPLEVSVYGPGEEAREFVLSSSKTEHSMPVIPGRYAVVARRPSGARLRRSVDVKDADTTVYLTDLVGSSPNEFMFNETMRGSVTRDDAALPSAPWRSHLSGVAETVLRGAMLSTLGTMLPVPGGFAGAIAGAIADGSWQRVRPANWTLRLWSLGETGWEDAAETVAALTPQADISSEFLKVVVHPQGKPLALGLISHHGVGPIVNLPPFADGLEISFLSRGLTAGGTERTHSVGGLRVPVALLCLSNTAAQDLMATLAEPRTPPAEQLWTQSAEKLSPHQGPWEMLIDKFARPAEALLAAHYLLRFLPGQLPIQWADNLSRALPSAMDGPIIAAWARLHNRPPGMSNKKFDSEFKACIELGLSRPVTLFARTRALLFDALRLVEKPGELIEPTQEADYRRFGAEAGGLESFWGGGPNAPGKAAAVPGGRNLAKVSLKDGAFDGMPAGPGRNLPLTADIA